MREAVAEVEAAMWVYMAQGVEMEEAKAEEERVRS